MNMINPGSQSNTSMLTFDGVDVMGKRLADEVCDKIFDFISHHTVQLELDQRRLRHISLLRWFLLLDFIQIFRRFRF